jgi:hypothetical protein
MNIEIKTSNKPNKKYMAVINNKKTIHFGDDRYSDYTMHKDPARKKLICLDISTTTIPIHYIHHSMRLIYFGIKKH